MVSANNGEWEFSAPHADRARHARWCRWSHAPAWAWRVRWAHRAHRHLGHCGSAAATGRGPLVGLSALPPLSDAPKENDSATRSAAMARPGHGRRHTGGAFRRPSAFLLNVFSGPNKLIHQVHFLVAAHADINRRRPSSRQTAFPKTTCEGHRARQANAHARQVAGRMRDVTYAIV